MDEHLVRALEFANHRQTLNNQITQLKTRAQGQLIYAQNGGIFTITQELICFFNFIVSRKLKIVNVLDDNQLPIQILDANEFLDEITSRYFEVTNDYFEDYRKIKKARNVKSIIDLEV